MNRAKQFVRTANSLLRLKSGKEFSSRLIILCSQYNAEDISKPLSTSTECWKVEGQEIHYSKKNKFHIPCT